MRASKELQMQKAWAQKFPQSKKTCQSYIEANFYMAFLRANSEYDLEPQYEIGNFRVDFYEPTTNTVIECDGYDYHKSKEQVDADCKRMRKLTLLGCNILRFSGVEINKDPDECVREAIIIMDKLKEQKCEPQMTQNHQLLKLG